jgi:hypothetical protein
MASIRETFNTLVANASLEWWYELFQFRYDQPKVVQYEIEGEESGAWHLVIGNESPSCAVHEGPAQTVVDLRLMLSDVDWLDIVAGRRSLWSLLASNRLRAEGDRSLIGDLAILGLLGPPVRSAEIAAYGQAHWVDGALFFVLPRVLTAGRLDHDKWRYFVQQRDLMATAASPVPWRALDQAPAARYAEILKPVLKPIWRLGILPKGFAWWFLSIAFVLFLFVVLLAPWWLFLLLLGAIVLFVLVVVGAIISLDDAHRRASDVLTRLACDDADFFRFALERRLMQISLKHDFDK